MLGCWQMVVIQVTRILGNCPQHVLCGHQRMDFGRHTQSLGLCPSKNRLLGGGGCPQREGGGGFAVHDD